MQIVHAIRHIYHIMKAFLSNQNLTTFSASFTLGDIHLSLDPSKWSRPL